MGTAQGQHLPPHMAAPLWDMEMCLYPAGTCEHVCHRAHWGHTWAQTSMPKGREPHRGHLLGDQEGWHAEAGAVTRSTAVHLVALLGPSEVAPVQGDVGQPAVL